MDEATKVTGSKGNSSVAPVCMLLHMSQQTEPVRLSQREERYIIPP